MKLWSVQALVITVEIVITLGALCSLGFGVSTRMSGCHFSSALWPKRKSSFTSLWSSVFADNIPYPPRGRTRPLKGDGGAGEMWSHPLFKPLPPGSFPTWPDNSWRAPYLPSELKGGPPLSRESTRLSKCIFVFPSKWCSFIISLFLLACFPHSLLLLSSHISQKSFPITPTLSRPLPFTLYTSHL